MNAPAQVIDFGLAGIARELSKLPKHWAFIPVGDKKAPQYSNWQNSGFSADDFSRAVDSSQFKGAVCKLGTEDAYSLPTHRVKAAGVLCGTPSGGLLFLDHDGVTADQKIPVSYTHLTLPTNREV